MRAWSGMILILAAFALNGCAAAGAAGGVGGGPLVSPTGREYEPGTPPSQTRFSQAALLAIAQGRFEVALEETQAGIAAAPENPVHYYLAGEAAAGLGDYETADAMWVRAEQIYPAYELEIEPSREAAWAEAFNVGVEAYNSGDLEVAIEHWTMADRIYNLRPEAAQNLGVVLTQSEMYEEAIAVYRRGIESLNIEPATRIIEAEEAEERAAVREFMLTSLAELLNFTGQFSQAETLLREQLQADPNNADLQAGLANALARQGRTDEAGEIYTRLLSNPNLPTAELFNVGVALFQSEDFVRAAQAFDRVLQTQPNSRDALYNQANALYAAEEWGNLIPVAQRFVQVDPLNSNGALILARAHREMDNNAGALQALEANEAYPIFVELQMAPAANQTRLVGTMVGNRAAAGSPVRLEFTFYGDSGQVLGTQSTSVSAPAPEATGSFEVVFDQAAAAYSYRVQP